MQCLRGPASAKLRPAPRGLGEGGVLGGFPHRLRRLYARGASQYKPQYCTKLLPRNYAYCTVKRVSSIRWRKIDSAGRTETPAGRAHETAPQGGRRLRPPALRRSSAPMGRADTYLHSIPVGERDYTPTCRVGNRPIHNRYTTISKSIYSQVRYRKHMTPYRKDIGQ